MKILVNLCLLVTLAIVGCKNDKPVEQSTTITTQLQYGKYSGILPCNDCKGIKENLFLHENGIYNIEKTFLGKGDEKPFVESGSFTVSNGILSLADSEELVKYLINGSRLKQLDGNGKEYTGDLAEKYILNKQ